MAVGRRLVYVSTGNGDLVALDRSTGAERWRSELDAHPLATLYSSPVVAGNLIVVGVASSELLYIAHDYTFRGSIVGVDARTGKIRWRTPVSRKKAGDGAGGSVWGTAAIDRRRGLAYIGTGQAYEEPAGERTDALLALRLSNGAVKWQRQFTSDDVFTLFNRLGPDYDIGASPNLFRIGRRSPQPEGRRGRWSGRDVVGVGDKAGRYAVLDRDTGATVWRKQLCPGSHMGGVMTTAAVAAGSVYVGCNSMLNGEDQLLCCEDQSPYNSSATLALDAATGRIRWRRVVPDSAMFGAITEANGVIYHPTARGTAFALDARTGKVLWQARPGGPLGGGVSVAGRRLFVPVGYSFFGTLDDSAPGALVAFAPRRRGR